jgi:SAM-dependent methyltransferase
MDDSRLDDQLARVRAWYDRDPEHEWRRHETGAQNRLEYLVTTYALERDMTPRDPPLRILDAGGGPGRYTIWLAERGHRMTLIDLSPRSVALARDRVDAAPDSVRRNVEVVAEGSITDLTAFPDASFDAVLCLGAPLSHLIDRPSRQKAVAEFRRVTRPAGLLFVSVTNRIGAYRGVVQWWSPDWARTWIQDLRTTGITDRDDETPWYLFLPEELEQEEMLLAVMDDPVVWPIWRDVLLETCDHPNVAGSTRNMLAVARRLD